jgi:hypothetical protein
MKKATRIGRLLIAEWHAVLQELSRQFLRDIQRKVNKEEE